MAANPFATAPPPPPQTMAQPNVQINYDDDDILMDYDDDPQEPTAAATAATPITNGAGDQMMEIEATNTLEDADKLAPEKIYLRGVDSMSTGNVKAFVAEHFTEVEVVKVEWIDDSSCNLVYSSPENAISALNALQKIVQELPLLALRPAKSASTHPESHLQVRIAMQTDRKVKGARDRSRYYLFHPEEDRQEQLERQRRDTRRPNQQRYSDGTHSDPREYERRYYDTREHDRRRGSASTEVYTDNFYDDVPRSRRSDSSSRDRSYSPGRERAQRQRSPIELFPERRGRESMEAYPAPERRREARELFPEHIGPTRGIPSRETHYDPGRSKKDPIELFPTKPFASGLRFRSDRSASPDEPVELFPEKLVALRGGSRRLALSDRITMPARSLEDRISFDRSSADDNAVERENVGFKIKGRGRNDARGDDLFAEKLRIVKGEGLLIDQSDGGGRRWRGQRRNRAEDMFG